MNNTLNSKDKTIKKLKGLEKAIKENVLGQEEVLPQLLQTLERGELGIADDERPKAAMLFLGPTGVGKTEITLTFTKYLFGDDNLFRFDMSEFMHFDSVKQFIGDETGSYGRLGNVLENNTHGTLLFDEMEKGNPQIMDLFLQILDKARITLGNGKTYSLHNYYIVFTSNIGAKKIPETGAMLPTTLENAIKRELHKSLRKEMIARFGAICMFRQLNHEVQKDIAHMIMKKEMKRMKKLGYELDYDDSAYHYVLRNGINEKLGIRPLRDTIQRCVGNALCDTILRGTGNPNGVITEDRKRNILKIR